VKKGKVITILNVIFFLAFLITRLISTHLPPVWEDNFSWLYRINYYPWVVENGIKGTSLPGVSEQPLKYSGKISYHPGVTVMTFSGASTRISNKIYSRYIGERTPCAYLDETCPDLKYELFIAKLPLIIISGLLLTVLFYMISTNYNQTAGIVFGLIVLFEPFLFIRSVDLHLDFLQAVFLVSATYLVFLSKHKYRQIIGGLLLGLALLTRFSSIIILPITMLCLLRYTNFKVNFTRLASFLLPAVIIFFTIYPAMWVAPLETTMYMVSGAVNTSQLNTQQGTTRNIFQLSTYIFSSMSLIWLTFLAVLVIRIRHLEKNLLIFLCIFLFYLVVLSVPSRTFARYITPIVLGMSVPISIVIADLFYSLRKLIITALGYNKR
jgi:hypothetical protein